MCTSGGRTQEYLLCTDLDYKVNYKVETVVMSEWFLWRLDCYGVAMEYEGGCYGALLAAGISSVLLRVFIALPI